MNKINEGGIGIVIIESLDESDKKTGKEIHEDTIKLIKLKHEDLFSIFFAVSSKSEFINSLNNIINRLEQNDFIPILHIEAHGSENGIKLTNGELVNWEELFKYTTKMNVLLKNKLIILLGVCMGNAIISAIRPDDRAPFRILIGVYREIYQIELLQALSEFYNNFFITKNIFTSVEKMNVLIKNPKSHFYIINSEECFDNIVNPDYNLPHLNQIINQLAVERKSNSPIHVNEDLDEIIKEMKNSIRQHFLKLSLDKDYFMMNDLKK